MPVHEHLIHMDHCKGNPAMETKVLHHRKEKEKNKDWTRKGNSCYKKLKSQSSHYIRAPFATFTQLPNM